MTLSFNTVFVFASIFVLLFVAVALILASPGAKRPKHGAVK